MNQSIILLLVSFIYFTLIKQVKNGLQFLEEEDSCPSCQQHFLNQITFDNLKSPMHHHKMKYLEKLIFPESEVLAEHLRDLREYQPKDSPKAFFGDLNYTDILTDLPDKGNVTEPPWSGSYWPLRYGGGAVRYSKYERANSQYDYKRQGNKVSKVSKSYNASITAYNQPDEFNLTYNRYKNYSDYISVYYSAAEKYDFYVGDYNFTLTNMLKASGKDVIWDEKTNDVPSWMGICHGWSVASYIEKRPNKTIALLAADGKTWVQFLPDDIKALLSIYWAEANYKSNFAGFSCKFKNKTELNFDQNTGLVLDYRCFGINPGSFHIIFGNWIGKENKTLIFEPLVNDNQIWNHPAKGYEVSYFNPLTNVTHSLADSIVTVEEAKKMAERDKFVNFTISNVTGTTAYLIGARMTVQYIIETIPWHENTTLPDAPYNKTYHYTLELDKNLTILGGEWLYNEHPNYVFGPREGDELLWLEDQIVDKFNGTTDELRNLTHYSRDKAIKRKSPLKSIVKYLINQTYNENYTNPDMDFIKDPDVLDRKYPGSRIAMISGLNFDLQSLFNITEGGQPDGSIVRIEKRPDGSIVKVTTRYVNMTRPLDDIPGGIRQPDGTIVRTVRYPNRTTIRTTYLPSTYLDPRETVTVLLTAGQVRALNYAHRPPANPNNETINGNNQNITNSTLGVLQPDGSYVRVVRRADGVLIRYITRPIRPINNPSNPPLPTEQPSESVQPSSESSPDPTLLSNYPPPPPQPIPQSMLPRTPGNHTLLDGTVVRTVINNGKITWYIKRPLRQIPPPIANPNSMNYNPPNSFNNNGEGNTNNNNPNSSTAPQPENNNLETLPQPPTDQPTTTQPTTPQPTTPQPTSPQSSALPPIDTSHLPRTPGTITLPDGTIVRTVVRPNGSVIRYITRIIRRTVPVSRQGSAQPNTIASTNSRTAPTTTSTTTPVTTSTTTPITTSRTTSISHTSRPTTTTYRTSTTTTTRTTNPTSNSRTTSSSMNSRNARTTTTTYRGHATTTNSSGGNNSSMNSRP
jgi:hypothetical protein